MSITGSTVVADNEAGALLVYPSSLQCTLVEAPYGHPKPSGKKKRKRKTERTLNKGELELQKHHSQISEWLLSCHLSLCSLGQQTGYFPVTQAQPPPSTPPLCETTQPPPSTPPLCETTQPPPSTPPLCETTQPPPSTPPLCETTQPPPSTPPLCETTQPPPSTPPLSTPEVDLVSLCNLDALTLAQESTTTYILKGDEDSVELFGHVISNRGSCDLTMAALGVKFTVPAQSSFLLSDVSKMDLLLTLPSQSFGLVVIDPPWENRSAIRGKKYSWLSNDQLMDLPVPGLLMEGAVVAVWVTNKRSIAHFVRETLFPHWEIEYIAEWLWIKVTTEGELVWPMDSAHKKPYEALLIGRLRSANEGDSPSGPPTKRMRVSPEKLPPTQYPSGKLPPTQYPPEKLPPTQYPPEKLPPTQYPPGKLPPTQYSLMAVPSCIHSQKPFLGDVLDRYAPSGGGRLELFARNLLPGWTSWGNEVLKFQVQRTGN